MRKNTVLRIQPHLENNLMILVENNNKDGVESYIKRFPPGTNDDQKSLAFLYSCKIGRLEIAKLLLDCVNPNTRYADEQTALMLTSQIYFEVSGKSDFMKLLFERGVESDLVDYCGKSALHWAVTQNCLWSARILTNHCDVNGIDILGMTPLMYAVKSNFSSLTSLLVHAGADPTKRSKQHGSAIHLAIRHKANESLKQMIPFFRHWNILDSRNQSPLDLAILLNNLEVVQILIHSGKEIEINRRPSFAPFRTPLEEACFKSNFEIVNTLINAGAEVNPPTDSTYEIEVSNYRIMTMTPIMLAVYKKSVNIVKLLLSKGADITIQCPRAPGHSITLTPLSLASEIGNMEIINLLEEYINMDLSIVGESFKSACLAHNIDVVIHLMEKYTISSEQYQLQNGLPVIFECLTHIVNSHCLEKVMIQNREAFVNLFTPDIAKLLSIKTFGSAMQQYRESWLDAAVVVLDTPLNASISEQNPYLNLIINFMEYFFLKKKFKTMEMIQKIQMQLKIFPDGLIRLAIHSSHVIKSILVSKSIYALFFFVEYHLDENLIFWDKKSEQILDLCEFALFFDNIDAALILNLACGISLNCVIEYESYPYVPEVINPSIERNDREKINTLKYLSKTVKPLKTLCKYAIRKYINSDLLFQTLSGISKSIINGLYLNFLNYVYFSQFTNNSLVKYSKLFEWTYMNYSTTDCRG